MFAIHLAPTTISPLYSSFKITDIRFLTDDVVTITKLYNEQKFTSTRFKTNEVIGTGITFTCKYLNRSINDAVCAIMIYYLDEFGYEKTVSVTVDLKSRLKLLVQSETSYLLK
jgi:hypothetical protein